MAVSLSLEFVKGIAWSLCGLGKIVSQNITPESWGQYCLKAESAPNGCPPGLVAPGISNLAMCGWKLGWDHCGPSGLEGFW